MLKIFKQTSVLVFLALFVIIFFPGYAKMQELRQKNRDLEDSIKKLQAENLKFSRERERLEKDPEYLERVGREKLGIVKKGEVVYKVVSPAEEGK